MRKWLIVGCLFSLFIASSAYAHVSGAFGDFLVGIKDESTTEKLRNEIKETKLEIELLTPKVNVLEQEYSKKEEVAVTKLKIYNTVGLDTFMDFVLQSEDMIDILANERLIEKNLESYLQQLNQLYLDYMKVKVTKEALEGHEKLLSIIEENLLARKRMLSNQNSSHIQIAMQIGEIWQENVGTPLEEQLYADLALVSKNTKAFLTRKTKDSPYRLEGKSLNEKSNLEYHIRSDHVYVHFQAKEADVILIGMMSKESEDKASLRFEAGFINGIAISNNILNELKGFEINYKNIGDTHNSKGFYVEQANGAIVIQPTEQAGE
jgi:hypothetical protein